jgi:hypothetical protein
MVCGVKGGGEASLPSKNKAGARILVDSYL